MNGRRLAASLFQLLKKIHTASDILPFWLNVILLDVLGVIHHGPTLAGGDPENHEGERDEK